MSVVGEPGRPPVHTGFPIADLDGGVFSALAITTALYAREKTGCWPIYRHQHAGYDDFSMGVHGPVLSAQWRHPRASGFGTCEQCAQGAFKAKDGYVVIACPNQKFYENLANAISREVEGLKDLARDERFSTPAKRLSNRKELEGAINEALSTKSRDEWLEILYKADVPAGRLIMWPSVQQSAGPLPEYDCGDGSPVRKD